MHSYGAVELNIQIAKTITNKKGDTIYTVAVTKYRVSYAPCVLLAY